jgi:hypothetical protein
MLVDRVLEWLYATDIAAAIRENELVFPWIEGIHVLAITIVVGSIAIVDLRLLGLASRDRPVTLLTRDVLPCTWIAFGIAAVTGSLLFSSNATNYANNTFFRTKLVLLALAGLNVLYFQVWVRRDALRWDTSARPPWPVTIAGAVSLLTWTGVVAAGRWIGFTMLFGS